MKNEWEAVHGQLLVYLIVSDELFHFIFFFFNEKNSNKRIIVIIT